MIIEASSHSEVPALREANPEATIVVVEEKTRTFYRPGATKPMVLPHNGVPSARVRTR
jgi:hypothetical protein